MQHANTHLEISYLARCSPKLVTCFWLYIHPKFYFCWLLIFCEWQHTRPNEMISRFMVEVHRLAEKLLAVLCCSCASLPGLNISQLNTSWHILPVVLAAYMIVHLSLSHQVWCNEVYPCHVHETDSALRIWSVCCFISAYLMNPEPWDGALGHLINTALQSLSMNWVLVCIGQLSPLLFMLLSSPLLIRDASEVPSITHKLSNLSLAPQPYL